MTPRDAKVIGRALGKSSRRFIQMRKDDDRSWIVIVPCNEHDSATRGCLVISDGSVVQLIGVRPEDYDPNVLYSDRELSATVNYEEPSNDDDPEC